MWSKRSPFRFTARLREIERGWVGLFSKASGSVFFWFCLLGYFFCFFPSLWSACLGRKMAGGFTGYPCFVILRSNSGLDGGYLPAFSGFEKAKPRFCNYWFVSNCSFGLDCSFGKSLWYSRSRLVRLDWGNCHLATYCSFGQKSLKK